MAAFCDTVERYSNDQDIQVLEINVDDSPMEDLAKHFDQCFDFIDKTEGACLVHCVSGISRSASIVIAYLIKK